MFLLLMLDFRFYSVFMCVCFFSIVFYVFFFIYVYQCVFFVCAALVAYSINDNERLFVTYCLSALVDGRPISVEMLGSLMLYR